MSYNVLIVEDEALIAMALEDAVESLGHQTVGIARNTREFMALSSPVDVALVDVNLEDGPTGPHIGRELAKRDVAVLFMTSDLKALATRVPGTLGVISKPLFDLELIQAIQYAVACRDGSNVLPPKRLIAFDA